MPSLKAIIGADAGPFVNEIRRARAESNRFIAETKSELVQNVRRGPGGGLGTLGVHGQGGIAQLIHVARASFDSLVSGMSPWRVFLQQAPQVAQAFVSIGRGATMMILRFVPVAGALAAVAGAFIWLHTRAERVKKAMESMVDPFKSLVGIADTSLAAWDRLNRKMDEFAEKMENLTTPENRMKEAIDDQTDAINRSYESAKRFAELNKQLADERGNKSQSRYWENSIRIIESQRENAIIAARKRGLERIRRELEPAEDEARAAGRRQAHAEFEAEQITARRAEQETKLTEIDKFKITGDSAEEQALARQNAINRKIVLQNIVELKEQEAEAERKSHSAARETERLSHTALELKKMEHEQQRQITKLTAESTENDRRRADEARFSLLRRTGAAPSVTERERIGLGAAPSSINVAIKDGVLQTAQNTAAMRRVLEQMHNSDNGSF